MKGRGRYPWQRWLASPFAQFIAEPGKDFDLSVMGDTKVFCQTLRNKASSEGLRVTMVTWLDQRVAFQFYRKDDPRPVLSSQERRGVLVECTKCGVEDMHPPRLASVSECVVRNPRDPSDTSMYFKHVTDTSSDCGLKRIEGF